MSKKIILLIAGLVLVGLGLIFIISKPNEKLNSHDHNHAEETIYTCPMHPEIRQNKPGKCPICGMTLVKVENDNEEKHQKANLDLNISPYQADLVGIKPVSAIKEDVTYTIPVSGRMLSGGSVALQVFESDLRYLKSGSQFVGSTEVHPDEPLQGEIVSIDTMADPTSRTIRVVGVIKSGKKNNLIESSFTGQVKVDLGSQIVIPEKSILFSGHGSYVYLYKDKVLHPQKVILGPKFNEKYVVMEGLKEGELISSGPNFLIDSESKIRGLNVHQGHH